MRSTRFLIVLAAILPRLGLGWGAINHAATAAIMEQYLTSQARAMLADILGEEKATYSAVYPDKVRGDRRFNKLASYHFVEIPRGFNYANRPNKVEYDSDTILRFAPGILKDPKVSRDRKLMMMRYLIHVMGDIHQPLHVGNGVDYGANLCEVNWVDPVTGKVTVKNLHSMWDSGMLEAWRAKAGAEFGPGYVVKQVLAHHPLTEEQRAELEKGTPNDWYEESIRLRESVYPDAPGWSGKPEERPYCFRHPREPRGSKEILPGKASDADLPRIDRAYLDKHLPEMELQVLKGGVRAARILNEIAKDYTGSDPTPEPVENVLSEILSTVKNSDFVPPRAHVAPAGGTSDGTH
jgi:hypothetical protein